MSPKRRGPGGPGFGHTGGSNLSDYLGATERAQQIELLIEPGERLTDLPVDLVDRSPYQPREQFDPEELTALGEDIKANGLHHPITVRGKGDGRYELVAGERRWLAVQRVGLDHVTARVRTLDDFDAHLIGVSENNQRASLSPWEMSVEATELLDHAKTAGKPHTQRDLARYVNRNVAIVNQQLAIASAINTEFLDRAKVSAADLSRLPHVTLHRIATSPASERSRALREAIRIQQSRRSASDGEAGARPTAAAGTKATPADEVINYWERGGFHVQVRKPFRDLDPARAQKYIYQLIPGLGGLAARAAEADRTNPVIDWAEEHGRILYLRSPGRMTDGEREVAREKLLGLVESLNAGVSEGEGDGV